MNIERDLELSSQPVHNDFELHFLAAEMCHAFEKFISLSCASPSESNCNHHFHPSEKHMTSLGVQAILGTALMALTAIPPQAQTPPDPKLSFEAATIKQNASIANGIGNRFGPELFSYTNVTLRILLQNIYGLKDYQVIGTPSWMDTDKWDIVARTAGATSFQQKIEMAKTLLGERFQLKFHRETRELPVYSLVAIKDGPKFQQPKDDGIPAGLSVSAGLLVGHKWDVSSLPNWLSTQLNVPVSNKVGLKGIYDFRLEWSPVPNEGNFSTRGGDDPPPAED